MAQLNARVLTALVMVCGFALAADKPNFSGTWTLQTAKSDFGSFPPPTKSTLKVDHQDPKLNFTSIAETEMGEQTIELKLLTDGTETTNEVMGMQVKTTAKWDGSAIAMQSKVTTPNGDVTLDERWSLADDGKTLTIDRKWTGGFGETTQKLVHAKQ